MSPKVTPSKSGNGAVVVIPESPERKAARVANREASGREAVERLRAVQKDGRNGKK
jgi:hypothetical protein